MFVNKRKFKPGEIPSASLADIVFLLLIFFLVTTSFNTDKGISLFLPPPGSTKEVPKKNICNILINAMGEVLVDSEPVQVHEIQNVAKQKIVENDLIIFSVKTDKKTRYQTYIMVLDQLKLANAKRISIAEPET